MKNDTNLKKNIISYQKVFNKIIEAYFQGSNEYYKLEIAIKDYYNRQIESMETLRGSGWLYVNGHRGLDEKYLKEFFAEPSSNNRLLDIGAGAGGISLYLQEKGYNITALEKDNFLCRILKKRDIKTVINTDIFNFHPKNKYNVAIFINNDSIFGTGEERIGKLFKVLGERVIKKNGRLVLGSGKPISGQEKEILRRRVILKGLKSGWLETIRLSPERLISIAGENGWVAEKIKEQPKIFGRSNYFLFLLNQRVK